jgi:hypothetical protein
VNLWAYLALAAGVLVLLNILIVVMATVSRSRFERDGSRHGIQRGPGRDEA